MHKDDVIIRTPCGADWNAMDPRGRARLCRSCDKLVHDLSGMSEGEAGQLLAQTPTSLCVRYLYDATGKIWFTDDLCQVVPRERLSRGARGVVALSALVAAPLLFQACGGADNSDWRYPPAQDADGGVPPTEDPTTASAVPADEVPVAEDPAAVSGEDPGTD
jgi:hypothetical protein